MRYIFALVTSVFGYKPIGLQGQFTTANSFEQDVRAPATCELRFRIECEAVPQFVVWADYRWVGYASAQLVREDILPGWSCTALR